MKAIILAAGRGSRMKKLTEEKPKCLVKLKGKALLDWQLTSLRDAGISEIAIVTGYKRELITNRGLYEFHNKHWANTNMVASLSCAEDWLKNSPCIVSYSDIFFEQSAVKSLISSNANIAVTYDPNWLELWTRRFGDPLLDAETFEFSSNSILTEIGNKPQSVKNVKGQYMGLLRFTPKGWSEFTKVRSSLTQHEYNNIHMTGLLQKLIKTNRCKIKTIPYFGEWGEIDNENDLLEYHKSNS